MGILYKILPQSTIRRERFPDFLEKIHVPK